MEYNLNKAQLIALDWGTSSLRAYLLGTSGSILEERSLELGIMHVQRASEETGVGLRAAFEAAFEQACGDWKAGAPLLPILASGMIGSAQGWCEAPYLEVPFDIGSLGGHLTKIPNAYGRAIYIVPGLIRRTGLVNVMRGEETEIAGALAMRDSAAFTGRVLIGMPGTHSKWAYVSGRTVEDFETFMTGEVYAALRTHTVLGLTMKYSVGSGRMGEAFDRGVKIALSEAGSLGVLSNIFSVRTLGLIGNLDPEEQPDFLSGILIGHEIRALASLHSHFHISPKQTDDSIVLVGDSALCARYRRALELNDKDGVTTIVQAAARGLWQVATQGGLISPLTIADDMIAREPYHVK